MTLLFIIYVISLIISIYLSCSIAKIIVTNIKESFSKKEEK